MDSIKIYKHVHRESEELSFRISRTEDMWEDRNGQADDPHRHDFYTVLLIRSARGEHIIDFNAYELGNKQVFFVSPGQVHQVIEKEKSYGYVILFSSHFLAENNIPQRFIDDLNLFNMSGNTPPLTLDEAETERLSSFCEEMVTLYDSPIKFSDQAIGSFLKLFLIQCNNLCALSDENTQNKETGNTLMRNFRDLVNERYSTWHAASEYADALNITPDHLNRVIKSLTGKTAKEFIQAQIIVAAKRMLYFTELSQKEIAFELGFSEPAHFSAFFKKETRKSPSEFRSANTK